MGLSLGTGATFSLDSNASAFAHEASSRAADGMKGSRQKMVLQWSRNLKVCRYGTLISLEEVSKEEGLAKWRSARRG
jgi:hypothetical protein